MIDPNKTYQTKSGREWRYYGENGNGKIHGAYKTSDGTWNISIWKKDGKSFFADGCEDTPLDIVEVKPRIKRTYWIRIYKNPIDDTITMGTREFIDKWDHPDRLANRLACVKVEIDCEVGEGL